MNATDTVRTANAADWGQTRAAGIFLHAGWRSCGTSIWERLRENAGVQAYYEPLHEDLAHLRTQDIGLLRPDSWQSGHGIGAPYFAEYAPLLKPKGGVEGHLARFAFDDYFLPAEQNDAPLESYLRALTADAVANGRLPVLKFCRSLGRVPWLEARFPDMYHAVILRDPLAQWRSARRQMETSGNRYFIVAPFMIFARNADDPLLANAAEHLAVKLPPRLSRNWTGDLSATANMCWRHVSRLSWQDRFRGFLALWIASGITALCGAAHLIDADGLSDRPDMCSAAEDAFAHATGLRFNLMPVADYAGHGDEDAIEHVDTTAPLQAALAFLETRKAGLPDGRAAILAGKLKHNDNGPVALLRRGAVSPGALAQADAAAYVGLMRASQPLRRAHFHIRRWTSSFKNV